LKTEQFTKGSGMKVNDAGRMLIGNYKVRRLFVLIKNLKRNVYTKDKCSLAYNVLQLNADFVLHKICDLGAVMYQFIFYFLALAFN
jgi:hypothetical protein